MNYRASPKFAAVQVMTVVITLLSYACAAGDMQGQQSASDVDAAPVSAANQNSERTGGADTKGQETTSAASAVYTVECGQVNDAGEPFCYVDRDTYVGWRTFHAFCHVCHAQDAVGSTFAPNLLNLMVDMDMDLFVDRVDNGFTGQVGVMPPWKDDPNVNKRYNELYAYLKARATGDLPPGRPKAMPKSN